MTNGLPIDLETFESLPERQQNAAIFKMLIYMQSSGYECHDDRERRLHRCEKRFEAIENRKWTDRSLTGGMGLIGGFLASLFKIQP
jgi:hypothetical protein